jgi:hypothetical protein
MAVHKDAKFDMLPTDLSELLSLAIKYFSASFNLEICKNFNLKEKYTLMANNAVIRGGPQINSLTVTNKGSTFFIIPSNINIRRRNNQPH